MSHGILMHVPSNPRVGTGNFLRSLTLAQQWVSEGGHVTFVTSDMPGILLRKVAMTGSRARYLSTPAGTKFAQRICELAREDGCQWIVTDDSNRDLVKNVGLNKYPGQKHIVLGNRTYAAVEFATGYDPSFALIRKNLLSPAPCSFRQRRGRAKGEHPRCLIDLSGLGPEFSADLLKMIIKRFTGTGVVFDIVTPFARSASEQLNQQDAAIREFIFWHRNPDRVFQALYAFDISVMSRIGDFYETAFGNLASLFVADESFEGGAELASLTSVPWIQPCIDQWIDRTCNWIERMIDSPTRRKRHAGEMDRLIDDQGAIRLCATIRHGASGIRRVRSA